MNAPKRTRISMRRSIAKFLKRVKLEDKLFSENEDDDRDSNGSFVNIAIERLRFPLPAQTDESICRDEYLERLLKPFKKVASQRSTLDTVRHEQVRKSGVTAEGMAVLMMIAQEKNRHLSTIQTVESNASFNITWTPEEKKRLYALCMVRFQKAAIEFLSVRLTKQLNTLINSWPGQLTEKEIPQNLFDWSGDYFIERNKSGIFNLDVLVRMNTKAVLDCTKFSRDLGQVIRLIKQIVADYKSDTNMCESSMDEIKKANYDINSAWLSDAGRDSHMYLNLLNENRRLNSICTREAEFQLQNKIDVMDGCLPIVQRYRRGWMHSAWDQFAIQLSAKEKTLQDELNAVGQDMQQDALTTHAAEHVYQYQINNLKTCIFEWEERFEMDQNELELRLAKVKSNLEKENTHRAYLEEQIKMFRDRVEEALEKEREIEAERLRKEEEANSMTDKKIKKKNKRGRSKERGNK